MRAGQKQLAIDNYKKSLELNPANDDAKEKLQGAGYGTCALTIPKCRNRDWVLPVGL
jgi:hypothetical protein